MPKTPRANGGEALWLEPALASAWLVMCLVVNYGDPWPYLWVTDLVCCAGAAAAYRWPITGTVAVSLGIAVWLVIPGVVPSAGGLASLIVVFAAYRKGVPWRSVMTLIWAGLLFAVLVVRGGTEPARYGGAALLLALLLAIAAGAGALWHRAQRLMEQQQQRAVADLEAFRLELARDLHDTVAQTLSASAMRANLGLADPHLSDDVRTDLKWIAEQCRSSAHDLREILGRLRGTKASSGQPLASLDTLRATVDDQVARLTSAGFTVGAAVNVATLSAARAQALSAVTLEAVNNIVRHAVPGTECRIEIRDDGSDVLATYTNVAGPATGQAPGLGLTGVRERLALLGGVSEERLTGNQWVLEARLPHGVETLPA